MNPILLQNADKHAREVLHLPEAFLPRFRESLEKTVNDSVTALSAIDRENPDYTEIRRITHILMGFGGTIGAQELGEDAILLNAAAHAQRPDACAIGIRRLLERLG